MARLTTARRFWRIGDGRFPFYSAYGASRFGAHWSSPGNEVIYAAESLAGPMLEVRVHTNGLPPPQTHAYIWIDVPEGLSFEQVGPRKIPEWRRDEARARAFGDEWAASGRTCLLLVPSVVVPWPYANVLINPHHPQANAIRHPDIPRLLGWDERLF